MSARQKARARDLNEPPGHVEAEFDAEGAFIGGAIVDPARLEYVLTLPPEYFLSSRNREIRVGLEAVAARGRRVDVITLEAELRRLGRFEAAGGAAYIATLIEKASVATLLPEYAALIRENHFKRSLARRARQIAVRAQQNGAGPGPAVPDLLRDVENLRDELRQIVDPDTHKAACVDWPLYDAAEAWDFPELVALIETLLPLAGVVWWGGLPKRFKSLLLLYLCLAIACRRGQVAKRFKILYYPKMLYVAREDGGARLQTRRDDILSAWPERPEPSAIRFVIRPHLDLLNPEHVTWLRDTCLREGITMLVLDTWTALSPTADPMGAKDQAQLAAVVVKLCEDIGGLVIVADHSRKNRPDGQALSSADIFGPQAKWGAAEHIVMLDLTSDDRRLEVFVEGKDLETRRFFLTVSPIGSGEEKFTFAGSVDELADAQRAVGDHNREAVLSILQANTDPLTAGQVVDALTAQGVTLAPRTTQKHLAALVKGGLARRTGSGPSSRYFALDVSRQAPSCAEGEGTG